MNNSDSVDTAAAAEQAPAVPARTLAGLAKAAGAKYSKSAIEDSRDDAIICPVPRKRTANWEPPPWMRRLHVAFHALAERWEAAARRPGLTEPGRNAHVLAHPAGGESNLLVIYVGYDPDTPNSILEGLGRAARFAAACRLATVGVLNPESIDPGLARAHVKMALQEMQGAGVQLTLHDSGAHGW